MKAFTEASSTEASMKAFVEVHFFTEASVQATSTEAFAEAFVQGFVDERHFHEHVHGSFRESVFER